MLKAIIFDMDGLMIDSEPFHHKAFDKVFREYGKELTIEDNNKYFVGISDIDAAKEMIVRYQLPISPEELVERKQKAYRVLIANEITSQPGLMELLQKLQEYGYKKAIASSSMLSEIELVMNTLKINKYIDIYCSAQEVKHGKPAPDLFLLAAQRLGIEPALCLVLEDAQSGMNAAKNAGMKCYIIPSRETKGKDFSEATRVLDSLNEVFENIKKD